MLRVALTGGIASGKSAAATMFRALGVPVIETDRIARDIVRRGQPALDALVAAFGESILAPDGELDRNKLRDRIFADATDRALVNRLLHPVILQEIRQAVESLDAPYVVVEIPLLVETGLARDFDRVLVIDAPEATQLERLQKRDGIGIDKAKAMLGAQALRGERLTAATDVIENTGALDALRSAVSALHEKYMLEAKRFACTPEGPQNRRP